MADNKTCIRCSKPAKYVCSRCKMFWYCSDVCQKQHWYHGHKGQCAVLTGKESTTQISSVKSDDAKAAEQLQAIAKKPSKWLYDPNKVAKLLSVKPKMMNDSGVGCGLKNLGNTCFLNSVLQCLFYTDPLLAYFRSDEHTAATCPLTKEKKFCMVCAMKDIHNKAIDGNYEYQVPLQLVKNLRQISSGFELGNQEDAQEFHSQVLMRMHEVLTTETAADLKAIKDFAERNAVEETSLVYQLFGGQLLSHVRCTECGKVNENLESFVHLPLDLSQHAASVEEAIRNFCRIEVLSKADNFRCAQCDRAVAIHKQLTIFKAPNILCVQLKRFDYLRGGMKINKSVAFREQLDLKEIDIISKDSRGHIPEGSYTYQLYGMIAHYGPALQFGHYVAFVKVGDIWWLFDDDRCYEVDQNIVQKQNAYLLYYKKIQGGSSSTTSSGISGSPSTPSLKKPDSTTKQQTKDSPKVGLEAASAPPATLHRLTPTYACHYKVQDSEIKEFYVKIEMPQEELTADNLCTAQVSVLASGVTKLDSALYHLHLDIPFALETAKCSTTFYNKTKTLLVHLAIATDAPASSNTDTITLPSKFEDSANVSDVFEFDEDNAMEIEATLDVDVQKPSTEREQKFVEGITKIENINVETNTYDQLYQDIQKLRAEQERAALAASAEKPILSKVQIKKSDERVGRNDDCPCGSGRKYKKCHGK